MGAAEEKSVRQGFVHGEIYNAARDEAASAAARQYQGTNARAGRGTPPNELGAVRATAAAKYDAANRGAVGATAAAAQRVRDGSGNLSVADQTAARAGIAGNRVASRLVRENAAPGANGPSQPMSAERLNNIHKGAISSAQRQVATRSKSLPQRLNEYKVAKVAKTAKASRFPAPSPVPVGPPPAPPPTAQGPSASASTPGIAPPPVQKEGNQS